MAALTARQAQHFHESIIKWQNRLGLQGWRIEPSGRPSAKGTYAQMGMDIEGRVASYAIGVWPKGIAPTHATIESTALHEVLHVLLADFKQALKKEHDPEAVMSAEHGIVNLFEKILMEKR